MKRTIAALLAVLTLTACATPQQYDAASDIHAFLVAIRDGDRATFDAHVDRYALRQQLEYRIIQELPRDPVLRALGSLVSAPIAGVATDALVRPQEFRCVAVYNGYDPGRPLPRPALIAQALRNAGSGQVCIGDRKSPCTLVFARDDGVWRLVAFQGDLKNLRAS